MPPKSLKFSWKSIPSNLLAIKLNIVIYTSRQCKQDVLQYLPSIPKKYTPMFEHGFLPLINDHSFRHTPPPPDNDMVCHASYRSHKK